jgi:hypothetical protein
MSTPSVHFASRRSPVRSRLAPLTKWLQISGVLNRLPVGLCLGIRLGITIGHQIDPTTQGLGNRPGTRRLGRWVHWPRSLPWQPLRCRCGSPRRPGQRCSDRSRSQSLACRDPARGAHPLRLRAAVSGAPASGTRSRPERSPCRRRADARIRRRKRLLGRRSAGSLLVELETAVGAVVSLGPCALCVCVCVVAEPSTVGASRALSDDVIARHQQGSSHQARRRGCYRRQAAVSG